MADFSIDNFVDTLRQVMYDNFPYLPDRGRNPSGSYKHGNYNEEIRDIAFMKLPIVRSIDSVIFDIGSEYAEEHYPYYHILEDSEVIQKRGKGTKKSKGSQDKISDKSARDYGIVKWSGKTFSQEYRKNVRGARSRAKNGTKVFVDSNGVVFRTNPNATYYTNVHYHYIEKLIDKAIPILCSQYGLKPMRVQDTKLSDEWQLQQDTNVGVISPMNILDIFGSFE